MENNKLKVAVIDHSPFIMESNGKYSGFEIELWEAIAKESGLNFEYKKHNFFKELIPLVVDKKADVALAGITINEEREKTIDFSHHTFDSGLRILLSKNRKNIDFAATIRTFINYGLKQLIKTIFVFLLIIFIFANALWLTEKSGDSFASTYLLGIIQAVWASFNTFIGLLTGSSATLIYDVQTWTGRSILILIHILGLATLGLLIGKVAAFITTRKIRLNIESPNDLKGKIVATVQGTTSEGILKKFGAIVVPTATIDQAYKKLKRNEVDAVVFDAPVLVYYALNDGSDWAEVVGELFDKQFYGVAFQENSPLREKINRAILALKENGYYGTLHKKYFGEAE